MEDSEFDRLFADKMRRAGAPDLSDEDWGQLSPLLEAEQRRRWRAFPLWWLGVLSLLLLGSNVAWWWHWQQSEKRSDALIAEWQQIRRGNVALRDTTWTKVVAYQYDTIYRTLVYRKMAEGILPNTGLISGPQFLGGAAPGLENGASTTYSKSGALQPSLLPGTLAPDTLKQNKSFPFAAANEEMLPFKPAIWETVEKEYPILEKERVANPPKQKHTTWSPRLLPRKVRVGAGMGWVVPNAANLNNSGGFSGFLSSEFAFSEQLALSLEGAYRGLNFKGTVYDESLGLPPETSPGDDYALEYFELEEEGLKPVLQLTVGMRYWLGAKHRFSPYLGLGYAMQWHPSFEMKLEYINQVTGKEKEHSVEVPSIGPISLLDVNAGIRYRFLRNLFWQTGGSYQFKMDASQPGIPRYWELKSSLLYGF